ncbi:GNAT family N-acetyltransferase [Metabacillus bambusae]|uniref:GNAT family N-acetyltransferase n=1 Tax=Metabacillus bambusae TaxID=2795218 RepID=A0ABS3N5B6_9BACI|nr:GNAT family protein [Metabacillus bambusae]MBO1513358.1 GNAT family N-acetyltransferase [Metabacillus bambusae]
MTIYYKGENIYLRELVEKDINDNYLSWFKNENVTEFLEVNNLSFTEVRDYIEKGKTTNTYFMYAICLIESDKHIGNLKIGPINWKHKTSGMPIVIGDMQAWGKGYASEAINLGKEIAFKKYNIRKLTDGMYSNNIGSLKAFLKAGWHEEARLKDHFLINGEKMDKICICCFNPSFLSEKHVNEDDIN